jgi:hypothetical protein
MTATATSPKRRFRSEAEVFAELFDFSPLGFEAGDTNLQRYVGNNPTNLTDPTGLSPWGGIGKILGKKWTQETCERAGKALATELLEKLAAHRPDSQKAQEIIRALKQMGWVEEALGKGSKAGKTLDEGGGIILREMENGERTGRFLEWYPGSGPHHADPHWKFSSGESGTLRTTVGGTVVAIGIALIPGAAQACEGDFNGAGRDVVWSATPGSWISDSIAAYWSWLYTMGRGGIDDTADIYRSRGDDPLDRLPTRRNSQ